MGGATAATGFRMSTSDWAKRLHPATGLTAMAATGVEGSTSTSNSKSCKFKAPGIGIGSKGAMGSANARPVRDGGAVVMTVVLEVLSYTASNNSASAVDVGCRAGTDGAMGARMFLVERGDDGADREDRRTVPDDFLSTVSMEKAGVAAADLALCARFSLSRVDEDT
jgi:hypothetical protein